MKINESHTREFALVWLLCYHDKKERLVQKWKK